jgi:radical SAM superfamily enzyme YgiQ (UPF0313 family)
MSKWPPLGLGYIAAVLEKEGHTVKILERKRIIGKARPSASVLADVDCKTRDAVEAFEPDLVGITATTPLMMDGYRSADLVKEVNQSVPVIAGGPHPTAEPELTLEQCKSIDIVVRGEGEETVLDLAKSAPWENTAGITFRSNGTIVSTPERMGIEDLDALPFPARHLYDKEYYFSPTTNLIRGLELRGTTVFTTRGCPFTCTFCQSPQLLASRGGKVRFHSPEYVVREILHLVENYNIQGLLFAEDIFNLSRKRVIELCERLMEVGLHREIVWAVDLRTDNVDRELFLLMKDAGCIRIIYGNESGAQTTLDRLTKKTTSEENYNAVALCHQTGITVESNIIVGHVDETEGEFLETLTFLRRTKPHRINRGKLCPLPGTAIYHELLHRKVIEKPRDWNELYDRYVLSDWTFASMTRLRLRQLVAKMDRTATLPANYMFAYRTNVKLNMKLALRQTLLMVVHCFVLYLPIPVQDWMRRKAERFRVKSRFVFE